MKLRFKSLSGRQQGFTLIELLVVITIIGILSNIGLNSFTSAQKKSRDAKRKAHLKQLADAFETYYNDLGEYPDDDGSGNIIGCGADAIELCTWGESTFSNTTNDTIYMVQLPEDPTLGQAYYYESFTASGLNTQFQLYSRLENTQDISVHKDESDNPQVYDGLYCDTKLCNYGVSSSNMDPSTDRTLITEE